MPQKSGLGRGLGALIPGGENALAENGVMLVPVDHGFPQPAPATQHDASRGTGRFNRLHP